MTNPTDQRPPPTTADSDMVDNSKNLITQDARNAPALTNPTSSAPSHTSLDTGHYGDDTDRDMDATDASEIKNALDLLDNRWAKRGTTVTDKLTTQEIQTQKALLEISELKQHQNQEALRAKESDTTMNKYIKQIESKQDQLMETQNAQVQVIEGLQETLI